MGIAFGFVRVKNAIQRLELYGGSSKTRTNQGLRTRFGDSNYMERSYRTRIRADGPLIWARTPDVLLTPRGTVGIKFAGEKPIDIRLVFIFLGHNQVFGTSSLGHPSNPAQDSGQ